MTYSKMTAKSVASGLLFYMSMKPVIYFGKCTLAVLLLSGACWASDVAKLLDAAKLQKLSTLSAVERDQLSDPSRGYQLVLADQRDLVIVEGASSKTRLPKELAETQIREGRSVTLCLENPGKTIDCGDFLTKAKILPGTYMIARVCERGAVPARCSEQRFVSKEELEANRQDRAAYDLQQHGAVFDRSEIHKEPRANRAPAVIESSVGGG